MVSIGLFLTGFAFSIPTILQYRIDAGAHPHILWQAVAYLVLMCAEVFAVVTCLEFSYTQAPRRMKSLVMALFLVSIAWGNTFTALVNVFIRRADGSLMIEGGAYFLFFTILMFVAAGLFVFVVGNYEERSYLQGDEDASGSGSAA